MTSPASMFEHLDVSRETMGRLEILADLLEKWNPKINLVSKSTLDDLWERHILDSAQLFSLAEGQEQGWVDLGSGGGFPGLVVAILAAEDSRVSNVTMVESDLRKSTFLRTVIRETGVEANVINDRIEKVPSQQADVLSARALADLSKLFEFSERHLKSEGIALFPKGINWQREVQSAQDSWSFEYESSDSKTQDGAVILKVRKITRV